MPWTAKVPPSELQYVHEQIDAAENASAADLFKRLNLARFARLRGFRLYVMRRRRAAAFRGDRATKRDQGSGIGDQVKPDPRSLLPDPRSPIPDPSSLDALFARLLGQISAGLASGTIPPYALGGMVTSLCKARDTNVKEAAEKRAAEMHDVKMAELRRRQATAVDALALTGTLTGEQVAEIRAKVLGL